MDNPEPLSIPYYMDCIAKGYRYECSCGGLHREELHAWSCRECRLCLSDSAFESRHITDIMAEYGEK